jgi:hypothetical protein
MEPKRLSAHILAAALVIAVAGDLLLREGPWGINFTLFAALIVASIVTFARRVDGYLPRESWIVAALGLATVVWPGIRDSDGLAVLCVLGGIGSVSLMASRKRAGELGVMTFADHIVQTFMHGYHVVSGFGVLVFKDLPGSRADGPEAHQRWRSVWVGIALALPALIIFGALLVSADAVFEALLGKLLPTNIWTVIGHVALISFFAWTIGGFLRGRFIAPEFRLPAIVKRTPVSLGITEIAILLGSLDLLFGLFVGVQIPYFFGGSATVLGTPSLTYAQYARRGFFELLMVAILSLPILLASDWLLSRQARRDGAFFTSLALGMVGLLGVMLCSGMYKLWIYMEAYGLTVARLNAAAIFVWVGVLLVLTSLMILRGGRERLPFAMALSGLAILVGLNAVNPEAIVARVNLGRMAADGKFDPAYTFRLSADAVPELLGAIREMAPEHRSDLARTLLGRYGSTQQAPDIRTWNVSRSRARALVLEREGELKGYLLPSVNRDDGQHE